MYKKRVVKMYKRGDTENFMEALKGGKCNNN